MLTKNKAWQAPKVLKIPQKHQFLSLVRLCSEAWTKVFNDWLRSVQNYEQNCSDSSKGYPVKEPGWWQACCLCWIRLWRWVQYFCRLISSQRLACSYYWLVSNSFSKVFFRTNFVVKRSVWTLQATGMRTNIERRKSQLDTTGVFVV